MIVSNQVAIASVFDDHANSLCSLDDFGWALHLVHEVSVMVLNLLDAQASLSSRFL